jgi:hypothetical protein
MANNESIDERIVWSPYPPPSHPEKFQTRLAYEHIHIKHPSYDTPLFIFPPLDAGGVHHETVRIACAIVDDNRWDGFLTLDKHGEHPVPASETILRAQVYYFQTSQSPNSKYSTSF